jgi:hypothetical protein
VRLSDKRGCGRETKRLREQAFLKKGWRCGAELKCEGKKKSAELKCEGKKKKVRFFLYCFVDLFLRVQLFIF